MSEKPKILIFIVSYKAEKLISKVLNRIPDHVWDNEAYTAEVLVIDDCSNDNTFFEAKKWSIDKPNRVKVLYNRENQGYGGNQKIGYHYAIQNKFSAVLLLHGDGQYPPELIDEMVLPIINDNVDVVFGSRMIDPKEALKGRMPLYKWIGNQILTKLQNWILGSNFTEFHSGFRCYSCKALKNVPFEYNSNYYDFDTDIIIQMWDTKQRFLEIPIPTYYGDEISRVDGIRYGWLILLTTLQSRFNILNLFYSIKFDYSNKNDHYKLKTGYLSSHQFALDNINQGVLVLDLGCGPGYLTKEIIAKGANVISLDKTIQPDVVKLSIKTIEADLEDYEFQIDELEVNIILVLDIIEHINNVEGFLYKLRKFFGSKKPIIIITTGNIAFIPLRIMLLLGNFNYGNRGILDKDHHRLFTFNSLQKNT